MNITFFKVRPKNHPFPIFAWLIMLFQGMNPFSKKSWSHMVKSYESESGNSKIIDVPFSGFREMKECEFFKMYHIVEIKKRSYDITRKQYLLWKEDNEHKNYDFRQIVGLMFKILGLKKINKKGNNLNSLICSELIISFLIRFDKLEVKDSDDWDLNMTWDII